MVGQTLRDLKQTLPKSRGQSLGRSTRGKQPWLVEALEDRLLLSGSPTIYTVNSTGNGTTGTGNSGTLPYVIGQANANTNTAGSEIQFDHSVFKTAQTITLASTLELSETDGPEVIDGPGRKRRDGQRHNAVEVFSVTSGVTASFSGLTISGGLAAQGGGLSVVGGTVSLTKVAVINNQAMGAHGASAATNKPGGAGGSCLGGGIYLEGGQPDAQRRHHRRQCRRTEEAAAPAAPPAVATGDSAAAPGDRRPVAPSMWLVEALP